MTDQGFLHASELGGQDLIIRNRVQESLARPFEPGQPLGHGAVGGRHIALVAGFDQLSKHAGRASQPTRATRSPDLPEPRERQHQPGQQCPGKHQDTMRVAVARR